MHYGKYRGEVVDVNDPEKRGRVRVNCPEVLGTQLSRWALPSFPPNTFTIPSKGTLVWIEFEGGRKDSPIWTGVFYTKSQWQSKFAGAYNPKEIILNSNGDVKMVSKDKTSITSMNSVEVKSNDGNVGIHADNGVITTDSGGATVHTTHKKTATVVTSH